MNPQFRSFLPNLVKFLLRAFLVIEATTAIYILIGSFLIAFSSGGGEDLLDFILLGLPLWFVIGFIYAQTVVVVPSVITSLILNVVALILQAVNPNKFTFDLNKGRKGAFVFVNVVITLCFFRGFVEKLANDWIML